MTVVLAKILAESFILILHPFYNKRFKQYNNASSTTFTLIKAVNQAQMSDRMLFLINP